MSARVDDSGVALARAITEEIDALQTEAVAEVEAEDARAGKCSTRWVMPKECPRLGWEYVGEEDLGSLDGVCDACRTEHRYTNYLIHDGWPHMLAVGCVCAAKMTQDYTDEELSAKQRALQNTRKRRNKEKKTWLRPECWGTNSKGNDTRETDEDWKVTIYPAKGAPGWSFAVKRPERDKPAYGPWDGLPEMEDAMRAAYAKIEAMRAEARRSKLAANVAATGKPRPPAKPTTVWERLQAATAADTKGPQS